MPFVENIKMLTMIRIEQIYRDFFDLNALLGVLIAAFAGYFFQSEYIAPMIGDKEMARIVALFTCVGFAVFIKNLSHRIDENYTWGEWFNKYLKIGLGGIITILLFGFDAYTSNTAIKNSGLEKTANALTTDIDVSQINEFRESRGLWVAEYDKYDGLEKTEGRSYRTKKGNARKEISKYDSLIAVLTMAKQITTEKANNLRIATVSDEDGAKESFFGSFLLLLAFGLELVSTGHRKDHKSAETAIDRIPYCVSPAAMATVYSRKTSVELNHTTTETRQEIPLETIKQIMQPKTGDEAIDLYARGLIGRDDGWNIRRIARDFFGDENKRTFVSGKINSRRELIANLADN